MRHIRVMLSDGAAKRYQIALIDCGLNQKSAQPFNMEIFLLGLAAKEKELKERRTAPPVKAAPAKKEAAK